MTALGQISRRGGRKGMAKNMSSKTAACLKEEVGLESEQGVKASQSQRCNMDNIFLETKPPAFKTLK